MQNKATLQLERYSKEARNWVVGSQKLADKQNNEEVYPIHLLIFSLEEMPNVRDVFEKAGVDSEELLKVAKANVKKLKVSDNESYLSQSLIDLLNRAEDKANKSKSEHIDLEHLLYALSQEVRGRVGPVFTSFKVTPGMFQPYSAILYKDGSDIIDLFTNDLLSSIKDGITDPVIGRDDEIRRLLEILKRRTKSHPLIVGSLGIGKFSIIRALALRMNADDVPPNLIGVRLLELNINTLVASARMRGELEDRVKEFIVNLTKVNENTILVIKNFDSLIGQNNMSNIGNLLKPLFNHDKICFIGTVTPEGYKKLEAKGASLLQNLTVMTIDPPSEDQAIEIIRGIAGKYEDYHKVKIEESAVLASVKLAKRFLQDRNLPSSAIDLLDETSARKFYETVGFPAEMEKVRRRIRTIQNQEGMLKNNDRLSTMALSRFVNERNKLEANGSVLSQCSNVINEQSVAETLGEWTGISVSKMLEAETEKLMRMESSLNARVVGQDEALVAISQAVRRSRAGLRDPNKPIGSFLFLGPSGVGKTELAKALTEFLFDDEQALVRLDMSEFMEKHMAQRLLGSPPGYVDSEQGGFLTETVKRRPYSILLFDEVEKAHADVFNLLLQLLDDGRLTDGRGCTVDFSNTVVIMTSNIGANKILDMSGSSHEDLQEMLTGELRKFFRPEFLNRIDDTVIFKHLTKECLLQIVDIQIGQLDKLLRDKQITVRLTDRAKKDLVDISYDSAFGARPLKRSILRKIQNPMSEYLLKQFKEDDSGGIAEVDSINGEFVFAYNDK